MQSRNKRQLLPFWRQHRAQFYVVYSEVNPTESSGTYSQEATQSWTAQLPLHPTAPRYLWESPWGKGMIPFPQGNGAGLPMWLLCHLFSCLNRVAWVVRAYHLWQLVQDLILCVFRIAAYATRKDPNKNPNILSFNIPRYVDLFCRNSTILVHAHSENWISLRGNETLDCPLGTIEQFCVPGVCCPEILGIYLVCSHFRL